MTYIQTRMKNSTEKSSDTHMEIKYSLVHQLFQMKLKE